MKIKRLYILLISNILILLLIAPQGLQAQTGSAPIVTIAFRSDSGAGFFTAYNDHNTVVVTVSDTDGTPLSGASISMEMDVTGSIESGTPFTEFVEVSTGVYELDMTSLLGTSVHGELWKRDRISDDDVTITVSVTDHSTVTKETIVRHIEPFAPQLKIPPRGFAIINFSPLGTIIVSGIEYTVRRLDFEEDNGDRGSWWLVFDASGNLPNLVTYQQALTTLFVEQKLINIDTQALQDVIDSYQAIIDTSEYVDHAQTVRDIAATAGGALSVGLIAPHHAVLQVVEKVGEEAISWLAAELIEEASQVNIASPDVFLRSAARKGIADSIIALESAINIKQNQSGIWTYAEANQYYQNIVVGLFGGQAHLEVMEEGLENTNIKDQLADIMQEINSGLIPSEIGIVYSVIETGFHTSEIVFQDLPLLFNAAHVAQELEEQRFEGFFYMRDEKAPELLSAYSDNNVYAPSVAISNPAAYATYDLGEWITINASYFAQSAVTAQYSIDGVSYHNMSCNSTSCTANWQPSTGGQYTVHVRVTDTQGRVGSHSFGPVFVDDGASDLGTPQNVRVEGITETNATLHWGSPGGAFEGYKVYVDGVLDATYSTLINAHTVSSFTCETAHNMGVRTYVGSTESQISTQYFQTDDCPTIGAPDPVFYFNAVDNDGYAVDMNWTYNSPDPINGFYLYQDGVRIRQVGSSIREYTVTGLQCGVTYTFGITAFNSAGESITETDGVNMRDCPPNAAQDIVFTPAETTTQGGLYMQKYDIVGCDSNLTTCEQILDGSDYEYASQGSDIEAVTVWSDDCILMTFEKDATILGVTYDDNDVVRYCTDTASFSLFADGDTTAVGGETVLQGEDIVAMAYEPVSGCLLFSTKNRTNTGFLHDDIDLDMEDIGCWNLSNNTVSYYIDGSDVGISTDTSVTAISVIDSDTLYFVTTDAPRTIYQLDYTNPGENPTGTISVVQNYPFPFHALHMTSAAPTPSPSAPTNLTVTNPTYDSIDLSWQHGGQYVGGFNVYIDNILVSTLGAATRSYTASNLDCATNFSFSVTAFNTSGESTAVATSGTTSTCPPPSAPTNLRVEQVLRTSTTLLWDYNGSVNPTTFRLYLDGVYLTNIDSALRSYTYTGLSCETAYTLGIRAANANGESSISTYNITTADCDGTPPSGDCYALTLAHTGNGYDPVATPTQSASCPLGEYVQGETIALAATSASGWYVTGWSGTANDSSTVNTNMLTMPASAHSVSVAYDTTIPNPHLLIVSDREDSGALFAQPLDGSTAVRVSPLGLRTGQATYSFDFTQITFACYYDTETDICSMNADGSNIQRLTTDPATDWSPVMSPDGQSIAFISRRNSHYELWMMDANGNNQHNLLTYANVGNRDAYAPRWSPDGSVILFFTYGGAELSELWTIEPDGSNLSRLTNISGRDKEPDYSPNGTQIAWTATRGADDKNIYIMNSDGTNQVRLTSESSQERAPIFSPDGTQLAFHTDRHGYWEVYVMGIDGSSQTNITNATSNDYINDWYNGTSTNPDCYALTTAHTGMGYDPVASPINSIGCTAGEYVAGENITLSAVGASGWYVTGWSGTVNDGSTSASNTLVMPAAAHSASVAYDATIPSPHLLITSTREDSGALFAQPLDGSTPVRLSPIGIRAGQATYNFDFTQITFACYYDDICSMNADGSNIQQLTTDSAIDWYPVMSPDGSQIAFASTRNGHYELWLMNADGTNQHNILTYAQVGNRDAYSPRWSPDGSVILFFTYGGAELSELWTIEPDGSNLSRLTTIAGRDKEPDYSPDGTLIAWTATRGVDDKNIYIMNSNGTNQVALTSQSSQERAPIFSPNGTQLAFHTDRHGYWEVYVMGVDGSNQTNITNATSDDYVNDWYGGSYDLDANDDGIISPTDAIYVINRIGQGDLTADVNGDGSITQADVEAILSYLGN